MMPQFQSTRKLRLPLACIFASALIAVLLQGIAGTILNPVSLTTVTSTFIALTVFNMGARTTRKSKEFTDTVGEEIDHIMIGAAETSHFVDSIKKKIEQDVQTTNDIVASAEKNSIKTEQIAANAERAARVAVDVRDQSIAGRAEADSGLSQINEAQRNAQEASAKMAQLQKKARHIQSISDLINEVARSTNLLALNAAIEAARAGAHGRGFAVVAGEVRQLSHRTKAATDDIAVMVREINEEAEQVAIDMATLADKVADATCNVKSVHAVLTNIEQAARISEEEIQQIAAASRENASTTHMITKAISRIRDNMLSTEASLPRATHSAMSLAERAEAIFEALASSGAQTQHDQIRAAAQIAAEEVSSVFEAALASGEISKDALFDRNYHPIPGTNPQKHTTKFDAFTDRVLPAIQEKLLEDIPQLAYAGAVDDNGYFPTHNLKFSRPLTGNYDIDLANNRTKRIFNDRTGTRCGSNTKPFLLQTYKRDTGEVMHDLSAPIYVAGKHWGGFRIGYRSIEPLEKEEAAPLPLLIAAPAR